MADLLDAAGRLVAVPLAALARARGGKPMHPRGTAFAARLERTGAARPSGVRWLGEPGADDVLVRLSRGLGLPARLPDLLGFALWAPGEQPVDLLLSASGRRGWARRLPVPRRDPVTSHGSVMRHRSPAGPVLLSVHPAGPGVLALTATVGRGPQQPVGRVVLDAEVRPADPQLHLDAVLHAPPGLVADGPLARFRSPAHASARAAQAEPRDAVRPTHR